MPSPEADLYFFHIPKTAGSSLSHFLRSLYPKDERFDFVKPEQLIGMSREQINRHRYFHGHVGNLLYPFLDRDVPTVTFLRDPFEQTISWLRYRESKVPASKLFYRLLSPRLIAYRREFPPLVHRAMDAVCRAQVHQDFQTHNLGVDFRDVPDDRLPRDYMTMMAMGLEQSRDLGMDAILERAKRRLDSMAVVGVTERFDESLGLVCAYLKVPSPEQKFVRRVATGRSVGSSYRDDPTVPKALARLVERHTFYDRQIYAYANALLDQRLAGQDRPMGSESHTGTHERAA